MPIRVLIILVCSLLVGCAIAPYNKHCVREESVSVAQPYCCRFESGYCQETCYNYVMTDQCVEWECDQGYVWEDETEDTSWWTVRKCVAPK